MATPVRTTAGIRTEIRKIVTRRRCGPEAMPALVYYSDVQRWLSSNQQVPDGAERDNGHKVGRDHRRPGQSDEGLRGGYSAGQPVKRRSRVLLQSLQFVLFSAVNVNPFNLLARQFE